MKNSTLFSLETIFQDRFYCVIENLNGNLKLLLAVLLFMGSFTQGVSAQGTLVPACNLIGPLTACVVDNPNDTSGDMVINLEVARSGTPNLIDAQHNANFVYSFPSNSSGAFIRSYGNVVYNSFTNRTTQTLIIFPGTTTSEFNLHLNVTNNTSSPATFCECSKSVSVSRVAASSSYAPIACYGQTTTLTAVGQFSDIGQYIYTLLPSGPSNMTGIFAGLAGSEAGITYTVNVESAEGCSVTTSQTITQPAFNPVILNCPESSSISACQSDAAINAVFNAWLNSFSFSGGTNASSSRSPQNPTVPALCGGVTTVTWTVTDQCGQPQSCTKTFTITAPPAVVVGQPANSSTPACSYADQAAANTAFAAWLAQFTATGGCAPQGFTGQPTAPPFCGGTTNVTYTVTDRCYQTSTVTRSFTITPPPAVVVGQPANSTTSACAYADQAAANAAFAAWLAQFTVTGGCAPQGSYGTPTAPPFCGGTTNVTYTVTDRCYQTSTVTRTFTITPVTAPVFTVCPAGSNLGCNPTAGIPAPGQAAAANECGAATITSALGDVSTDGCLRSQTRTYTATDRCGHSSTCTQVFTWKVDVTGPVFSGIPTYVEILGGYSNGTNCATDLGGGSPATVTEKSVNGKALNDDKVNFAQPRNQDHPAVPLYWTYGVNNITQAEYFEGMGVPQRIIFTQLTGTTHTLRMRHEAVKHQSGDRHAYDFLMSWEQAIATAANIGNGTINELQNLLTQQCLGNISANGATVCQQFTTNAFATLTDNMGNPPNHHGNRSVNSAITNFEAQYGNRQIEIKGNAPITNFNIVFEGYSGTATGDNYAWYTINWQSSSPQVMIKLAGRAAQGAGTSGYGNCYGAGSINGAPYHFKLESLDGHSLGNRDNQLMVDASCSVDVPVSFGTPTVTDNCSTTPIVPTVVNEDVVTINPDGSKTHCKTWRATDDCGNSTTFTQCIKVICVNNSTILSTQSQTVAKASEGDNSGNPLGVKIYPNPASDDFNVELSGATSEKVSIVVYDMLGRLVDTKEIDPTESSEIKIGTKYPAGIYNVIVAQATEVKTVRVIKR